jgi:hypothetical protein
MRFPRQDVTTNARTAIMKFSKDQNGPGDMFRYIILKSFRISFRNKPAAAGHILLPGYKSAPSSAALPALCGSPLLRTEVLSYVSTQVRHLLGT